MILRLPHKKLETRIHGFWPRARFNFLVNPRLIGESVSRLIGVSAHRLAGLAICEDFMRKMGDFEAALQKTLTVGKGLEASRATKFLSKSSAHR